MAVEFAVFCHVQSPLMYWLYIVAKVKVSAIDNLKTIAGGHIVYKRQAILLTMVVISIHFV